MGMSMADGLMQKVESGVILDFLEKNFNDNIDIIKEQAFLRAYPTDELPGHVIEVANQLYKITTPEERNKLIEFAMKVVMADKKMEKAENSLINAVYDAWGLD